MSGLGKPKARAALVQAPTAMPAAPDPQQLAARGRRWASLIAESARLTLCAARAGSLMRVVSFITQPGLIRRILDQPRKTPRFASVKFRSVSFWLPRWNRS